VLRFTSIATPFRKHCRGLSIVGDGRYQLYSLLQVERAMLPTACEADELRKNSERTCSRRTQRSSGISVCRRTYARSSHCNNSLSASSRTTLLISRVTVLASGKTCSNATLTSSSPTNRARTKHQLPPSRLPRDHQQLTIIASASWSGSLRHCGWRSKTRWLRTVISVDSAHS
jgi:hypothetical protein